MGASYEARMFYGTRGISGEKKSLEINKNAIAKGEKFLLVDDGVETGTQIKAAIKLIKKSGGKVVGISSIGIQNNKKTEFIQKLKHFSVTEIQS